MNNWLQYNFNAILIGIITGLFTIVIGYVFKELWKVIKISKSKFSGEWEQQIFDNNDYKGQAVKIDVYELKHIKTRYSGKLIINIEGIIKRTYPTEQTHREWDFIGYLDGDILTILYQSQEGQRSRGCIYAKLFTDFEFRGYYLEEHNSGIIDTVPLIIKKRV